MPDPAETPMDSPVPEDMKALPSGIFWMGSDDFYPEERPCRQVEIAPFLIDIAPVTNRQFRAFVKATGHRTLAERKPAAADYPGADPRLLRAGSSVFTGTSGPVLLNDPLQWWAFVPGANWRRPEGPKSTLVGREDHPVVHIAHEDAVAYAAWCGKRLPTEAEWEYAARGGADRLAYAWGDELAPGGRMMANYWTGDFPWRRTGPDGGPGRWRSTAPVGAHEANGFGLLDMIGNVWEWTSDWYGLADPTPSCCIPRDPRGAREEDSHDPASPGHAFSRKVLKGGSHLCAESYCRRYRPAARHPQTIDTSTSHIGFRCARSIA